MSTADGIHNLKEAVPHLQQTSQRPQDCGRPTQMHEDIGNHEETPDKSRLRHILYNNHLVIFKNVNVMKDEPQGTAL